MIPKLRLARLSSAPALPNAIFEEKGGSDVVPHGT
jgi:hypothetical protein